MEALADKLRKQRKKAQEKIDAYKTVSFRVDTIAADRGVGAYFTDHSNSITINYKKGDDTWNEWTQAPSILIHEEKHRSNAKKGMHDYATSVEQEYKLDMHDEISANIAQLIELRQEYLETRDIEIFHNKDMPFFEENGAIIPNKKKDRFKFYTDAIKNGEIDPHSTKQADFDKEMSLIANGTQQMWIDKFSLPYEPQSIGRAMSNYQIAHGRMKPNEEHYRRAKDIAYTIGGVNFGQYMKQDVVCNNKEIKDLDKAIAQGRDNNLFGRKLNFPVYQENMDLEQYYKLTQHKFIANNLKYANNLLRQEDLTNLSKSEMSERVSYLKKVLEKDLKKIDTNFADIVDNMAKVSEKYENNPALPKANDTAFRQEVEKMYTINGVNYCELLDININKDVPYTLTNKQNSNIVSHFKPYKDLINPPRNVEPEDKFGTQYKKILDLDKDIIRKPNDTVHSFDINKQIQNPEKKPIENKDKAAKKVSHFLLLRGIASPTEENKMHRQTKISNANMSYIMRTNTHN